MTPPRAPHRLRVGDRCETVDSHPWPLIYAGRRRGRRLFATYHGDLWAPPPWVRVRFTWRPE